MWEVGREARQPWGWCGTWINPNEHQPAGVICSTSTCRSGYFLFVRRLFSFLRLAFSIVLLLCPIPQYWMSTSPTIISADTITTIFTIRVFPSWAVGVDARNSIALTLVLFMISHFQSSNNDLLNLCSSFIDP